MRSGYRSGLTGWLLFMAVAVLSVALLADEIRVPEDYRTIQQAVREAKWGDTIIVSSRMTIRDSITLRNVRRLTIQGEFRFRRNTAVSYTHLTLPTKRIV